MGLFKGQFANVVEWEEYRDDIIFWKWTNREIKKGSCDARCPQQSSCAAAYP